MCELRTSRAVSSQRDRIGLDSTTALVSGIRQPFGAKKSSSQLISRHWRKQVSLSPSRFSTTMTRMAFEQWSRQISSQAVRTSIATPLQPSRVVVNPLANIPALLGAYFVSACGPPSSRELSSEFIPFFGSFLGQILESRPQKALTNQEEASVVVPRSQSPLPQLFGATQSRKNTTFASHPPVVVLIFDLPVRMHYRFPFIHTSCQSNPIR